MASVLFATRLDTNIYNLIDETKISKKEIVLLGLRTALDNLNNSKHKKIVDDIITNNNYRTNHKDMKNKYFRIHLIKNTIKRILDISYMSYALTGCINMDLINEVLTDATASYELFNEHEKTLLKKEFLSISKFSDEKYLFSFLRRESRKRGDNILVFKDDETT